MQGRNHRIIAAMWNELQETINKAYLSRESKEFEIFQELALLSDYVDNGHKLRALVAEETQNEKLHRNGFRGRSYAGIVSSIDCARVLIMHAIAEGSTRDEMPAATNFLMWRHSAAESHLIGYLMRAHIHPQWRKSALALDYAELVKGGSIK